MLVERREGAVLVVDAASGSVLRTLPATGANETPPAIHDRILYQVQPDGRITGIHIDNPFEPFTIWRHASSDAWLRVLDVDAHRLYVADGGNELYAIDRVFGRKEWTYAVSTHFLEELAISGDTLVLASDGGVRALDARTGRELWMLGRVDGWPVYGPAAIMNDSAYVATADGKIFGLALADGKERWRYEASSDACSQDKPRCFARDGVVYACFDGATRAVSVESGKVVWTHDKPPVALGEGVLVVRGDDDTLVGVETAGGRQIWTRTLDQSIATRPVVDAGVAYVRDHAGKLHALAVETGEVLWVVGKS